MGTVAAGNVSKIFEEFESPVTALSLSPDGQTLVLGDAEAHTWKVDLTNPGETHIFCGHHKRITSLEISADGTISSVRF